MYKITFSKKALDTFHRYFTQYKQYYIERFSDTGIYDEHAIQSNYHKLAESLSSTIFESLHKILSQEVVY